MSGILIEDFLLNRGATVAIVLVDVRGFRFVRVERLFTSVFSSADTGLVQLLRSVGGDSVTAQFFEARSLLLGWWVGLNSISLFYLEVASRWVIPVTVKLKCLKRTLQQKLLKHRVTLNAAPRNLFGTAKHYFKQPKEVTSSRIILHCNTEERLTLQPKVRDHEVF